MRRETSSMLLFLGMCVVALPAHADPVREVIQANANRAPAGTLRNGELTLQLEARTGMWRPQAEDGGEISVQAFGEVGKPLQIPGPLVRVRSGTKLRITLRNHLSETLVVYGLHPRPGDAGDSLHIAPGALRSVEFDAGSPGTYYYWAATTGRGLDDRTLDDSQLHGALVIDPATGPVEDDRIFVMGMWLIPEVRGKNPQPEREVLVINGKSWPHTERFEFTAGDSVRWRWVNPTASSHPMHLHGFYFKTSALGDGASSTMIPPAQQRLLATHLMLPGETMDIRWVAEREGNWVFHCHFAFHVSDQLYLAPQSGGHGEHASGKAVPHSMAGLVIGMSVRPNPKLVAVKSSEQPRRLRLIAQQRTDTTHPGPRLGYALSTADAEPHPDSLGAPGPLMVLRRNQPVSVTVVNRLKESTAVHWHGIELESFPDGVPGWSGTPARIMPPIAPQDSFVAEFVPPRSGTFIYHSHSNELNQILGGLVGPLVVLDDATDLPANEHVFLVSAQSADGGLGLVNGQRQLPRQTLDAGKTYRFRFINIGDWRVFFTLLDHNGFAAAKLVAKDGADLPEPVTGPLNLLTGPGETADFEVMLPAGKYRLEFKQQLSGWIIPLELVVR